MRGLRASPRARLKLVTNCAGWRQFRPPTSSRLCVANVSRNVEEPLTASPPAARAPRAATRPPAAEQGDELAPVHCPIPPVLPTERIAHLGTADSSILLAATS